MSTPVEGTWVDINGQRFANAKWVLITAPEKKGMTPTPSASLDLFKRASVNNLLYGTPFPVRNAYVRPEAIEMTSFLRPRDEQ